MITLRDLRQIPGSKLHNVNEIAFTGAVVNSKEARRGTIFVALRGKRDGHDYIQDAVEHGAGGVIIDRAECYVPAGVTTVLVSDALDALHILSKSLTKSTTATLISVTGSVGKTTTKDMIACAIGQPETTVASEKSYNNHIGVPLTLLKIEPSTKYVVTEIGTNHPGEIFGLATIVSPHIGVVTNVGHAHIGNFDDQDALADEKVSIIGGIRANGHLIINGDDPQIRNAINRRGMPEKISLTRVGFNNDNDIAIQSLVTEPSGTSGRIRLVDNSYDFHLPVAGKHFTYNLACAVAVGSKLGISPEAVLGRLSTFKMPSGRSSIATLSDSLTIIDDSYNGSPDSMMSALETLQTLENRYKIVVLGEMRELGTSAHAFHRDIAQSVAATCTHLVAVGGELAELLAASAVEAGMRGNHVHVVDSAGGAAELVRAITDAADSTCAVLVKGSRFSHMERAVLGLGAGIAVRCKLKSCNLYIHCSSCPSLTKRN